MMFQVKIKVRPNQTIRFPGICVHCARPAHTWLPLRKRIGRATRLVDVPLCADCAQTVAYRSGEEERLQKLRWLALGAVVLLIFPLTLLLTPGGMAFILRLLIAVAMTSAAATAVWLLFHRPLHQAARPEKQAVLASARIAHFSWRATTFEFQNETFAERFRTVNEPLLMNT